jgi:imidazole glycerol-phosphate synthase subunit HisH
VDLGIANIGSVVKALSSLDAEVTLTSDPFEVAKATKLILPGVGSFGAGMAAVRTKELLAPIRDAALTRRVPVLGICLGMQLLARSGEETGAHEGLGILGSTIKSLDPLLCPAIPHMGWNNLESTSGNPILEGLNDSPDFFFVHSYHMVDVPGDVTVSFCTYGNQKIVAAVARGNVMGTQFHPEKSQGNGMTVLRNFLNFA